jgi:hypothetical protein
MVYFSSLSWRQITEKSPPFIAAREICRMRLLSRDQLIRKSAHSFRSGFPNSLGGIRRKKIHGVRLPIAELSHIEHEQLRFAGPADTFSVIPIISGAT